MAPEREKPLIAVVEDEPDLYELCLAMIELWGYGGAGFVDGEEALSEFPKLLPDLVMLDIRLPGRVSGIDILRYMRETPILATIPAVMMTAYKDKDIVVDCLKLGADDFFYKPLPRIDELKARLDTRLMFRRFQNEARAKSVANENPIFISYSRGDWDRYVKPLVSRLQAEGLHIWVDQQYIEGSDDWLDEINNALKASAGMIVCLSPESLQSRYVKMEYRYAFNNNKRLYPLICSECELPAELQILQYYTYSQLDDLVKALKSR